MLITNIQNKSITDGNSCYTANNNIYSQCNPIIPLKNLAFKQYAAINPEHYRANYCINFNGAISANLRKAKYPVDHYQYRAMLAREVGCQPDKLMSVVGPDEFKDIVKGLTPRDFFSEGSKNINPDFKATLHMHTCNSDGTLTVEEMLDKAVEYSNKMKNPPFFIALTDHDTVNQGKEALKLIAQNPEKYKNIRYVPGIEFTTVYKNNGCFKEPVYVEFLGYCINPFDAELNTFLDTNRRKNVTLLKEATKRASKNFGIELDFEEARQHPYFKLIISTGLRQYLLNKGIDNSKIDQFFEQNPDLFVGKELTTITPVLDDITEVFKTGILGMSHPGRVNLKELDLKPGQTKYDALTEILTDVNQKGVVAAEANYQYHLNESFVEKDDNFDKIIDHIYGICDNLNLLKTGGIDAHGKTIFERKLISSFHK
ncbi:MAG: hypothetical protein AB1782_16700 [Cyanobacteriota bacterium]